MRYTRTIYYYCILAFVLSFISCKDVSKERVYNITHEWIGKEIKLPKDIIFTNYLSDTVNYSISDNSYKVVTYIDSTGCASCKLQLLKWKDFIAYTDSACDKRVKFLFIFQSQDKDKIRALLKRDNFQQPVCFDTEGRFDSLNHIPKEKGFQTFLLDEGNRIIAIGSPIQSPRIKDLYLKKLFGEVREAYPTTNIQADSAEFDLGVIKKGETKSYTISLQNVGTEVFHLKGINTSCDCINVSHKWNTIPAKTSSEILVSYTSEDTGEFIRTITIYGNIPHQSFDIEFKGIIE